MNKNMKVLLALCVGMSMGNIVASETDSAEAKAKNAFIQANGKHIVSMKNIILHAAPAHLQSSTHADDLVQIKAAESLRILTTFFTKFGQPSCADSSASASTSAGGRVPTGEWTAAHARINETTKRLQTAVSLTAAIGVGGALVLNNRGHTRLAPVIATASAAAGLQSGRLAYAIATVMEKRAKCTREE